MLQKKIVGKSLIRKDKGLSRSYIGNGIGTIISGMFGGMPVTTYGENVGVMALTKVYAVGLSAEQPYFLLFYPLWVK